MTRRPTRVFRYPIIPLSSTLSHPDTLLNRPRVPRKSVADEPRRLIGVHNKNNATESDVFFCVCTLP